MIVVESNIQRINKTALAHFARRVQKLAGVSGEVAVLIAGNGRIRELNRRFRKKDQPTDVLSFPRESGGDIAISAEIALQNAGLYGHAFLSELKILVLHGMLHLAGHDHENDRGEMTAQESLLRQKLGLPDSLIERTQVRSRSTSQAGPKRLPKGTRFASESLDADTNSGSVSGKLTHYRTKR